MATSSVTQTEEVCTLLRTHALGHLEARLNARGQALNHVRPAQGAEFAAWLGVSDVAERARLASVLRGVRVHNASECAWDQTSFLFSPPHATGDGWCRDCLDKVAAHGMRVTAPFCPPPPPRQLPPSIAGLSRTERISRMFVRAFHCTSREAATAIVETQTFRRGMGGLAGGGMYFADTVEDAQRKARQRGVTLEATVYLGQPHIVPPNGDGTISFAKLQTMAKDSVIIPRANGNEYVVYSSDQVSDIIAV
jgi:hypothetical protein